MQNNKALKFRIKPLLLVLLFSFSIILSGCSPSDEDISKSQQLHEEGDSLVAEYKFGEAMDKFEEALQVYEGNSSVYGSMAEVYVMKNRPQDALEVLTAGIDKSSNNSDLYRLKGQILLEQGKIDDAIEALSEALDEDSENEDARYYLALAHTNKKDFEKSREYLDMDKFVQGDTYAKAALLKAVILQTQVEDAEAVLDGIDTGKVDDERILSDVNAYNETLKYLGEVDKEELSDKYRDVILAKGALEADIEDAALDLLEKYKDLEEEYWEVYFYLGQAYYLDDELDQAEAYLENSAALNPASSMSPWMLGRVYYKKDDIDKAEENYLRAIELAETEKRILIREELAGVAFETDNFSLADEQYQALIEENSQQLNDYYLERVFIAYERGLYEDMDELLEKIDTSQLDDSSLARFYYFKSASKLQAGDRTEAVKWIEDAIELDNKSAAYYLLYGQILFEDENTEEARKHFERAVDLDLSGEVSPEAMKFLDRI